MQKHSKAKAIAISQPMTENSFVKLITVAAAMLLGIWFFPGGINNAKARQFPQCNSVPVEAEILRDFNWAEENTWQRGFKMDRLSRMHEHRTTQFDGSPVTRRYCMATAHLSNGQHRSVYYLIEDIGGFVGKNWNVTHCVIGLDPWHNHDGNCRTLR